MSALILLVGALVGYGLAVTWLAGRYETPDWRTHDHTNVEPAPIATDPWLFDDPAFTDTPTYASLLDAQVAEAMAEAEIELPTLLEGKWRQT